MGAPIFVCSRPDVLSGCVGFQLGDQALKLDLFPVGMGAVAYLLWCATRRSPC